MECPGSPPRVLFECDFCEGVFHTVRALRAHRYKVHGIESNAEVMVDVEHVACQMDVVNAYIEPDHTSEITIEWDDCDTHKKFKHHIKQQQHKPIHRTLPISKQKNKVAKKRQKAVVKKRRISLNNMPACFQAAQVNDKQSPDNKEKTDIDILKSIYGDANACDSDLGGNSCLLNADNGSLSKTMDKRLQNKGDVNSELYLSPSKQNDLSVPSKMHPVCSKEVSRLKVCTSLSSIHTIEESLEKSQDSLSINERLPYKKKDNKPNDTKREDLFTKCKSENPPVIKLEPTYDKISQESSHQVEICKTEKCKEPYPNVRQLFSQDTNSRCQQQFRVAGKGNAKAKPRTRTKARLKKNLRRGPGKRTVQRNVSLQPFVFKPTPSSDSPPHLSPITSLPNPPPDTPRVPKVRLKRQNSTEFKAYFIPCGGAQTTKDDGETDEEDDYNDDDDDDRPMPDLERQADLIPVGVEDVGTVPAISGPPPTLLEKNDLCSTGNLWDVFTENRSPCTKSAEGGTAEVQNPPKVMDLSKIKKEGDTLCETAPTDTQNGTDIKQEKSDDDHRKVFICQFCGKVYKWIVHFRVHESKHATGKMFHCRNCDFSAVDRKDVIQHCEKLEHRMAGTTSLIKRTQCTWLGDQDSIPDKSAPLPLLPVTKKSDSPWQQKKLKQNKKGCKKESTADNHGSGRKVDKPVSTKSNKGVQRLDKLIENFTSGHKQKCSTKRKLKTSSCDASADGIILTDVKSLAVWHDGSSGKRFTSNLPYLHQPELPVRSPAAVKSVINEPVACGERMSSLGKSGNMRAVFSNMNMDDTSLLNSETNCDVPVRDKQTQNSDFSYFQFDAHQQEPGVLGKRKKKNNKLFNHKTKKGIKKVRIPPARIKQELDPACAESGCQRPMVSQSNSKNAVEKPNKKREKKKKTDRKVVALKKCKGQRKKTLQSTRQSSKKEKCMQVLFPFQGHSNKGKGKVGKKDSRKVETKLGKRKSNLQGSSGKKGRATSPKKPRGGSKRNSNAKKLEDAMKCFEHQSVESKNYVCEFSEKKVLQERLSNNICTTDKKPADNLQTELYKKEPKQNNLQSLGRSLSGNLAGDSSLTMSCHQCQKSFEASNCSESPDRRRPGLVHRRHLVLDEDADEDVGYHSSGSLDQISHDESHDPAGGQGGQSRQCTERGECWKEKKNGQKTVCCHIRRWVTNLFEDAPGDSSQETVDSVNNLPREQLDAVKQEMNTSNSMNLPKTRSFLDSLLPTRETFEPAISNVEMFKSGLKVKQEPVTRSQTGGINAQSAITDFAAKLSKFRFRVKPEPLKGQKSDAGDVSNNIKVEQAEPGNSVDQHHTVSSSVMVINRCDSGVYVESPTNGMMNFGSVGEEVERKPVKAESTIESMQLKSERRSLWDCVLPDLFGDVSKSGTDATEGSKSHLLTEIKTEGSKQHEQHYIYCPACRSQVIIKTEPPASENVRLCSMVCQAPSSLGKPTSQQTIVDGLSNKLNDNIVQSERYVGSSAMQEVSNCCHVEPGASNLPCSVEEQSLNNPRNCSDKVCETDLARHRLSLDIFQHAARCHCSGYRRVQSFTHCYQYVDTDEYIAHRMTRLVKHRHHIPTSCCDNAESAKTRHRNLQAPYPWQHTTSSIVHSHTDDCIYNGCQQY